MKITLLYGLPGSGKTFYAQSKSRSFVIDCDKMRKNILNQILKTLKNKAHKSFIIDGLFTTNKIIDEIFSAIKNEFDLSFEIIYWEKDIESCLWNDRGRRQLTSETTIKNIPFEEINQELIDKFNIKVVKKKVIRKPESAVFAAEKSNSKNSKLESSRWCLGGSAGNYSGDIYPISAEPQPEFIEFDNLLESIKPNITFLQYKRLFNQTVTIETSSEGDYYGGSCTYGNYVCDLEKLYNLLKGMEYI